MTRERARRRVAHSRKTCPKVSWAVERRACRQRGSAMIEFAVVGPLLVLLGTVVLQYALMFNARNIVNHATFMAARAGSMAHADLGAVQEAYARALVPLYGGGASGAEIMTALAKANADLAGNARIELINPTRESFDDWSEAALALKYGGKRAIPNANLGFKDVTEIRSSSGQNIQDANLIKLKITHGYELKVPFAGPLMQKLMSWGDSGGDPFVSALYGKRRIPLTTHVTLQMHSDPVEPGNPVSIPGMGNGGVPTDPGMPDTPAITSPNCVTAGCTVTTDPNPPAGGGGTSGGSGLDDWGGPTAPPPVCQCPKDVLEAVRDLAADMPAGAARDRITETEQRYARNLIALEHARLSQHTYAMPSDLAAGAAAPVGWKRISNDSAELALLGLNEEDLRLRDSNFGAEVYLPDRDVLCADERLKTVVAFKGTQNAEDWDNNFAQAKDEYSPYYEQAVRIGRAILEFGADVDFAGHSLGGGMASAASRASGRPAETFNSAGLHANTVPRYGGTVHDSAINAYRVKGELLTAMQEQSITSAIGAFFLGTFVTFNPVGGIFAAVGKVLLSAAMPDAAGTPIELGLDPEKLKDRNYGPLDLHVIERTVEALADQNEKDRTALTEAAGQYCRTRNDDETRHE